MDPVEAERKIVSDVKNVKKRILGEFPAALALYVGKTQNIEQRAADHKLEGLPYTLPIAHGSPTLISNLEKSLISALQKITICHLVNKESNSNGNPDADWLYLSLDECHPNDELCEYDTHFLLGSGYPIELA